ncbi:ADP-ribosylglycohydrolase family protein [Allokutzneria sp. A3M-2-11 16]|uniref:ADP-ribosylglycohydrolase family protein n=1 Tax=Allokutzneria sp. A3M-2-11 16 TaxID=2962043 RepID=UPI0020B8C7BE|nr:ADP-ribosylglycohydrolase family protein [Allokutzneria sp. A3M-2-11 16]MCP3802103.1 ADP-ribosylglycohydrolase family protein [Allokutzneria sp. A3M-2-11 16]
MTEDKARGALLGLAVGDALGAPAENLSRAEIAQRWGRVEGFLSDDPVGTDDTEYAVFSALLLIEHGAALSPSDVEKAWRESIVDQPLKGAGFSERGTVENLQRGLAAPLSAQHRHGWSDGLAMRATPFGVFAAGDPAEAARLVAVDGSISHEGEGILGGQAVAAAVAAAMAGASLDEVIAAGLTVIPEDSWTSRAIREAVAAQSEDEILDAVVVRDYPWTDLAPEAVALAFGALVLEDGDVRTSILTAVNMGRDADTTAAIAGAVAGALHGESAVPQEWAGQIGPVRGACISAVAGHHITTVADTLHAARVPPSSSTTNPPVDHRKPQQTPAATRHVRTKRQGGSVVGALMGLAVGDSLGWPAAKHRAGQLPAWTRRLARELDAFAEAHGISCLPVPMALNQPTEALRLGPTDDAEWAVFAALAAMDGADALRAAWIELAGSDRQPIIARISVRAGLANLVKGLRPPASGHDNPHFFDDAACSRAVGLATLLPGDPAAAAALAEVDARHTQDGDGVLGARAMAAAISSALGGATPGEAVDAALLELPEGTEIGRNARRAVHYGRNSDTFSLVPLLDNGIVDHVYSYGTAAAETVPVALALVVASGARFGEAVSAAACLSRLADSAPALTGALAGALSGDVPMTWRASCRELRGTSLPWLAGTDLIDLAGRITARGN